MILSKLKISGHSMEPQLSDGDEVLASSIPYFFTKPKVGDIVVVQQTKILIKRIANIQDGKYFIVGDNKKDSFDSRKFGSIDRNQIRGKVIYHY